VRFDSIRPGFWVAVCVVVLLVVASGCKESAPQGPAPQRFAGVKKTEAAAATPSPFCEKTFPKEGEGALRYADPPLRPLAGEAPQTGGAAGHWRWVNLWATWCQPCVEEMGLLGRWRDGLSRDGLKVAFELVSIDEAAAEKALVQWKEKNLPGGIRWLRSEKDLNPLFESLSLPPGTSIPVHALVDPAGQLRCVRVGAIHEQDYGTVKKLIAEG
jgi:hypothetical protein